VSHESSCGYNAMKEVIGNAGIVTKENVIDYTDTLEHLINSPLIMEFYSNNAIEQSKKYTYEAVIPKIKEVWDKVINS
jgi:glycosyltransferase involved in cell wall biosynthesis